MVMLSKRSLSFVSVLHTVRLARDMYEALYNSKNKTNKEQADFTKIRSI
jgi:hypothetical protein